LGIRLTCLTALLFALGAGFVVSVLWQETHNTAFARRLAAEGVLTPGVIEEVGPYEGRYETHRVRFRYAVDGKDYSRMRRVFGPASPGLQTGMDVTIRYLRSEPGQSWIAGRDEPVQTPAWDALAVVPVLIACAVVLRGIGRQRSLLAEGAAVQGHLTNVRPTRNGRGFVTYEFRTVDHAIHTGSAVGTTEDAAGMSVTVVYDRDNPERNARYPLVCVEVDE
jgi:hypothetical protein